MKKYILKINFPTVGTISEPFEVPDNASERRIAQARHNAEIRIMQKYTSWIEEL